MKVHIEEINNLIKDIDLLPSFNRFGANPEFDKWKRRVARIIENIFGKDSSHVKEFKRINFIYSGYRSMEGLETTMDRRTFDDGLASTKSLLESYIEELDDHGISSIDDDNNSDILNLEDLLHPLIKESAYPQYLNEHYRDAVLNAVIALFDQIRTITNTKEDGVNLIGKVFSLSSPKIILSNLDSESGQNDQKGFMQIFQGAYQGIRNPKAHTLNHDLSQLKSAQYLVFASLLARRIEEASIVDTK